MYVYGSYRGKPTSHYPLLSLPKSQTALSHCHRQSHSKCLSCRPQSHHAHRIPQIRSSPAFRKPHFPTPLGRPHPSRPPHAPKRRACSTCQPACSAPLTPNHTTSAQPYHQSYPTNLPSRRYSLFHRCGLLLSSRSLAARAVLDLECRWPLHRPRSCSPHRLASSPMHACPTTVTNTATTTERQCHPTPACSLSSPAPGQSTRRQHVHVHVLAQRLCSVRASHAQHARHADPHPHPRPTTPSHLQVHLPHTHPGTTRLCDWRPPTTSSSSGPASTAAVCRKPICCLLRSTGALAALSDPT